MVSSILSPPIFFNGFTKCIQNIIKKKDFLIKAGILFLTASLIPILPSGSFFTSYGAAIFWINYSFLIKKNRLETVN